MGMDKNVGAKDRTIRVIAGILLLGIGVGIQGVLGLICAIVGIGLLFTAITRFCSLYKLCGINTCRGRAEGSTKETG